MSRATRRDISSFQSMVETRLNQQTKIIAELSEKVQVLHQDNRKLRDEIAASKVEAGEPATA